MADIFNHKASVVSLSEEYEIAEEAMATAAEEDGAAEVDGSVENDEDDEASDGNAEEESDDGKDDEDSMVLFSCGLRPPPLLNTEGKDGVADSLRLEIGICSDEEKNELQVIAGRSSPPCHSDSVQEHNQTHPPRKSETPSCSSQW